MHTSLWSDGIELPEFKKLQGDLKTDVLVIGGGLCGILCAYFLKKSGVDCTVVEAGRVAGGVTGNTTAKITALHGLVYGDLAEKFGFEVAQKYLYANDRAIEDFAKIARQADCDFTRQTAYTYSLKNKEKIEREVLTLQRLGADAIMQEKSPLPISFAGAVGLPNQAQFHPLKFVSHIVKDLNIYEHTRITEFTPHFVRYDGGKIQQGGGFCLRNRSVGRGLLWGLGFSQAGVILGGDKGKGIGRFN